MISGGAGAPNASFTFDVPDDVERTESFTVNFIAENAPDLEAAGLDVLTTPTLRVYPARLYGGLVQDQAGTAISGASVELVAPASYSAITPTDSLGLFGWVLPDTGSRYSFIASKDGFLSKEFTSAQLPNVNPSLNLIELEAAAENGFITGTVSLAAGGAVPTSQTSVSVVYPAASGPMQAGQARPKANADFRIDLSESTMTAIADALFLTMTAAAPSHYTETIRGNTLPAGGPIRGVTLAMENLGANTVSTLAGGASVLTTVAGQNLSIVQVPFGSLDTAVGATVPLTVTALDNIDSYWTRASGGTVYVIDVPALLSNQFVLLTVPFSLEVVGPGQLENGTYALWYAATQPDIIAGRGVRSVAPSNIVATDYVSDGITGLATFRHYGRSGFSVFAAGGAVPQPAPPPPKKSSGGCFISTTAEAPTTQSGILPILVGIAGAVFITLFVLGLYRRR
jgi:hypothetical protein